MSPSLNPTDIFIKQPINQPIKQANIDLENNILSKKEILDSIPIDCSNVSNNNFSQVMTEWRWRFLKIPDKNNEVVEISYKTPNENRKYINNKGDWVERNIGTEFDIFVTDEYYFYT